MTENKFSLRWETFRDNLKDGFSKLQQMQEFVDVTLAAGGHFVKVHQNILALASPYFKEILKTINQGSPYQHPVIFLGPIDHVILSYILEYMYTGEVKVPCYLLSNFVEAAKMLHIVGIKDLPQNTEKIQSFADKYLETMRPKEPKIPKEVSDKYKDNVQDLIAKKTQLPENSADPRSNIVEDNIANCVVENSRPGNIEVPVPLDNDRQMTSQPLVMENENELHNYTIVQATERIRPENPEIVATSIINDDDDELSMQTLNTVDENLLAGAEESFVQPTEDVRSNNIAASITIGNDNGINVQTLNTTDFDTMIPSHISFQSAENIKSNNYAASITINDENNRVDVYLPDDNQNDVLTIASEDETSENLNCQDSDMANDFDINDENTESENICTNSGEHPLDLAAKPDALSSEINDPNVSKPSTTISIISSAPVFVASNRGSLQLILNRFIYNLHHTAHHQRKRRWRCMDYRRIRCPAFVDTDKDTITRRQNNHTHLFHDTKIYRLTQKKQLFTSIGDVIDGLRKEPLNRTSHE